MYSDKGTVIIMGDMNAHKSSNKFIKNKDGRAVIFESFLNNFNLTSVNTLDFCTGAKSSFVSYNGIHESLIDHIIMPYETKDIIISCEILEDNAINVSTHRPIVCEITMPLFDNISQDTKSTPRLKWSKASVSNLNEFEYFMNTDSSLNQLLETDISSTDQIDYIYSVMVESLVKISNNCIPKTKFRKFLKPYWNSELSSLHKNMTTLRKLWVDSFRPRDNSTVYNNYKSAKCAFRRCHRRATDNYLIKLNVEIDKASELDSSTFWKIIKMRNSKGKQPGCEMKFNDISLRDSKSITREWGNYFETLYTPSINTNYDANFFNSVSSNMKTLIQSLFSTTSSNSHIEVNVNDVNEVISTKAKKSKAPGEDTIVYEHFIYSGTIIRKLLAKLYTAMLRFSHCPYAMKSGVIVTLFKGGNKLRNDPNSYRAITLSSVFIRLYEAVLLLKLKNNKNLTVNRLQGGFQKNLGCLMTSLSLKESILYAKENKSKVYVCFLDARQAFDRVWHDGLFLKLYNLNINIQIFKAFYNLYIDLHSRVRYNGHYSDRFSILQGTRQGGLSSPMLYLLFINDLINELQQSGLGMFIYDYNFSCPTVADDMCLVSFSKTGLDKMIQLCYQYACKWRFEYNHAKCAVVVFNETVKQHKESNRVWKLGKDSITGKDKYTHLGSNLDKYMNIDDNVNMSISKLRGTYFSLMNCGIHENGISPLTSYKMYKSLVLPKALYGCELWSDLSQAQLLRLERSHRFCIKSIQNISTITRTDIALSMLGCFPLIREIDYRKLTFFGQICNLPGKFLAKDVFLNRLVRFKQDPYHKQGFIPDVHGLLVKYGLVEFFNNYATYGIFPSSCMWKAAIRQRLDEYYTSLLRNNISWPVYLRYFPDIDNPCCIWGLSKKFPKLLTECQSTIQLLSQLFSRDYLKRCNKCGITIKNIPLHLVFHCSHNESSRIKFWREIYIKFGFDIYASLIKLDFTSQITHLCSGLSQTLKCDTKRERCLVLVVKAFHEMYTWISRTLFNCVCTYFLCFAHLASK